MLLAAIKTFFYVLFYPIIAVVDWIKNMSTNDLKDLGMALLFLAFAFFLLLLVFVIPFGNMIIGYKSNNEYYTNDQEYLNFKNIFICDFFTYILLYCTTFKPDHLFSLVISYNMLTNCIVFLTCLFILPAIELIAKLIKEKFLYFYNSNSQ